MRKTLLIFVHLFLISLAGEANTGAVDSLQPVEREIHYDSSTHLQTPTFDVRKIEGFKKNRQFDYSENHGKNWWQLFKEWLWKMWVKFWEWIIGDYKSNGIVAFFIRYLPYIIILATVIFIGWLFYRINPGGFIFSEQKKPSIFFSEEEEIIRSKNIHELIDQALAQNNYRLAVRYYYLLVLQVLTQSEQIDYVADKTNSDYIQEIRSPDLRKEFKRATNLYDYIWYGNFAVTQTDFEKARPTFLSLANYIGNQNE